MSGRRYRVSVALAVMSVMLVALAGSAQAAVSVSRAEVSGTRLRIEGRATASRPITVDGVQMTTSDGSGSFKIDRSGYTPPADCTVDVNDGSATAVNVRLSGCTVSTPPVGYRNSIVLAKPARCRALLPADETRGRRALLASVARRRERP